METHANISGGQDTFQNGMKVGETHTNIFGGHNFKKW